MIIQVKNVNKKFVMCLILETIMILILTYCSIGSGKTKEPIMFVFLLLFSFFFLLSFLFDFLYKPQQRFITY